MALTKSEILQGRQARRTISVPALGDEEVEIRPLTDGEFHQIQSLYVDAVQMTLDISAEDLQAPVGSRKTQLAKGIKTDVDVKRFAELDYEASTMAAAFGLSVEEEWTPDEVSGLPAGAAEQIADEVYDLSGAHPEQEVMLRHFRDNRGGRNNREVAGARSAASDDASGPDTRSEDHAGRSIPADLSVEGGAS